MNKASEFNLYSALPLMIAMYVTSYLAWLLFSSGEAGMVVGDFFSLAGDAGALALLVYACRHVKHNKAYWLMMMLSVLFFFLGDAVWVYHEVLMRQEIPEWSTSYIFYSLNSLFLMLSTIILAFKEKGKWDSLQLLMDSITVLCIFTYISWLLFFKGILPSLKIMSASEWRTVISVMLDFIALSGFLILTVSRSDSIFPRRVYFLLLSGIAIFCVADAVYYHQVLRDSYMSSNIVDLFWYISVLLIGASGYYMQHMEKGGVHHVHIADAEMAAVKDHTWIMLIPLGVIFITNYRDFKTIAFFSGLVLLHHLMTRHIKISAQNAKLLVHQKELNNSLKVRMEETNQLNEQLCEKIREIHHLNENLELMIAERTYELKAKNAKLDILANCDPLTCLPNRRNFLRSLDSYLSRAEVSKERFALLFIDIDRFKEINDTYGHSVGDKVLVQASKRMSMSLRSGDFIARHGGDEFIAIIDRLYEKDDILPVIKRIRESFELPLKIEGHRIQIGLSVGAAVYPYDGTDKISLLKCADSNMYLDKFTEVDDVSIGLQQRTTDFSS
ncbi:signaling protein YkoW (plasmid) [Peptoclostridium acidaminophilum DSM 3953]|uniref:Signaling protein YkoW n=1 Tax=Peptoclostridium acidaminophilum DSM 3953 TaxID=1286171 RepID=W8T9B2_PEPAC|nr:diguanylate cyclase [Peptoclostridium acidaminophilum]AHM57510.1 signaling protein YkoW [Peptoclostridium acidaminophilum DSM 3953]